jgi:hypothetical protein
MSKIARPDFFIVGAPKCGTTAMNDFLAAHPDVFMARKELHFFGSDLSVQLPHHRTLTLDDYLSHFSGWRGESRIGEGSVWYLFSKNAAGEIKAFDPNARIIAMLRNPVDMLYANYYHMRYTGDEFLPTFEEALAAVEDRRQGRRLPKLVRNPQGLVYDDMVCYAEQVRRYFDTFGRDNVRVIIFEEFRENNARIYRETLEFLGVDPLFQPDFTNVNPPKLTRYAKPRDFLDDPPQWYRHARQMIPTSFRQRISRPLRRWNTTVVSRPPIDPELRHSLQTRFAPQVEELSILLDRDLLCWRET